MSGHNKWSTIKNKKAKTDAAKGKIFTKIGREIVIAVKTGGRSNPASGFETFSYGRCCFCLRISLIRSVFFLMTQ